MEESNENAKEKESAQSSSQKMRWLWPLLLGILLFAVILYFWKGCGNSGSTYSKTDSTKVMDSMNNEAINAVMAPDTSKKYSDKKAK
jgi:hypothetical protein